MKTFFNIFLFFTILAIATFSTGFAVVATAFAGSGNSLSIPYFLYLGLTQGIPIIIYAVSFISIAFCILLEKQVSPKISSALGISLAVYISSFFGLLIYGLVSKLLK